MNGFLAFCSRSYGKQLVLSLICWAVSVPLFAQLPIGELPWQKGDLLYENSLSEAGQVADWVMEGPGTRHFAEGWMHLQSPDQAYHHVFWCPEDFPADFVAEWEVQNQSAEAGLAILFFAAQGNKGESIFDPALPKRDGTFRQYTKGAIRNYHISYYANTPFRPDRGDSHLRKNPGFSLVQTGKEGIPAASMAVHHLRLIKSGPHIRLYVDERKVLDWMDREDLFGPVHGSGKMGFRQMQWTHMCYRNFRVWGLKMPPAEIGLTARVLHPRSREWVSPPDGQTAPANPPILLCPTERKKGTTYAFRLSKEEGFPAEKTQTVEAIPWAMYPLPEKLSSGTWYWQYRADDHVWSKPFRFFIRKTYPDDHAPDAKTLISAVPKAHPRLLAFPDQLPQIRSRLGETDAQLIVKRAREVLNTQPPRESKGEAKASSADKVEQAKLEKDASKKLGIAVRGGIEPLCQAWLLTGEERYARAAVEWAMEVASWDPEGVSYVNNFADSDCMLSMAMAYDACFDFLDESQKQALETAITARAHRFYAGWISGIETKVFSAHVWQHILEREFKTALALLGEVPEADLWLSYVYELWLARAPVLGPEDGGWWNGNHYVELNALSLMDIPSILESLTGKDYFQSSFYQNHPLWLTYSFPPNSYSEGFGNGTEKQVGQKMGVLGYMDALGRKLGLPYADAYADWHMQAMGKKLSDDDEFRWYRLRWSQGERQPNVSLAELPQARSFPETGTVNMHSDLLHPERNLMLSMRSSPFGSPSHSHADQNGFNIQFGGQKLFYNSGYRPSMGVPHYEQWFKATIGHNTVLIDGKGQPNASGESYGWLPRFLHGDRLSYSLGDASKAYDNEKEKPQEAGLTRFRRHMLLLRPSTIVIYDELEADHAADWSWLLHSHAEISKDPVAQRLFCETETARSQVDLLGSVSLDLRIGTEFDPAPENFRGLLDEDGEVIDFQDQWHLYAQPESPQAQMRYLAVIQVQGIADSMAFSSLEMGQDGWWKVGEWEIRAELDGKKAAGLEVRNVSGTAALSYGHDQLRLGENVLRAQASGSTLLLEQTAQGLLQQEAIDQLPKVLWTVPD